MVEEKNAGYTPSDTETEHRHHTGQSLPFGNSSFTRNNVGYLSVEQALSDYAVLIAYLREEVYNVPPTVPVVAFGGSYGAWLRAKFHSTRHENRDMR